MPGSWPFALRTQMEGILPDAGTVLTTPDPDGRGGSWQR